MFVRKKLCSIECETIFFCSSTSLTVNGTESLKEYNKGFESRYIEYPTPLSFSSVQILNKIQSRFLYI
ncbi:hypothetical protein BpHYR1_036812 [Brachionus plicatilis]|uniref:Uncharacterized protein n=1 Tax=Brachionus plicatilis TaxID=10195 RepID=A0A3M7SHQ0_BRAPC|nr:hypothetical protein BpHYR1_036812 [Brachionus plicatilis]